MAETMSRTDFNRKQRHGHAGTAGELMTDTVKAWRAASPDWDGKHWALLGTDRGTALAPVNVR